ncbi:hypothetical protein WDZ92_46640, partial [Nostoc sp. NIES-2111]
MASFRSISRRDFGLSTLALLVAGSSAVRAAPVDLDSQAEWTQSYDAATTQRVGRSLTPVLSPATLAATEQMIETFRGIAAQGGWPEMPQV